MKYILIHAGRAHRDEFLTVGLVCLITNTIPLVYRRDPTEEELNDPEVWVLDVGRRHDPERHNFDHHQLPVGTMDCALSLVAKAHEVEPSQTYHDLFATAPWYKNTILRDTQGHDAVPRDKAEMEAEAAIESYVLCEFSNSTGRIAVEKRWVTFALDLMSRKVETAKKLVARFEEIQASAQILPVKIRGQEHLVMYGPELDTFGVNAWLEKQGITVIATVTKDPRSGGVCLYRSGELGASLLDFRKIADAPGALFVHTAGFMMTVQPGMDMEDHIVFIRGAAQTT
jgi:hypothetical protein